jgi:flagellar basal body-associated protein FliL
MKKIQIFIIILLLLFLVTIIFYNYFNIQLESFSIFNSDTQTTPSTTTTNTTTTNTTTTNTTTKEEDQFKYFKILPEYNRFSDETREELKKKYKKNFLKE